MCNRLLIDRKSIFLLQPVGFPELKNKCEYLVNAYADLNECKHFDHCLTLDKNFVIVPLLCRKIISDNLNSMIPNIKISLIITVLDSDQL